MLARPRAFATVIAIAAAALALVFTPVAAAEPATYVDPAGDAKSAPDVTTVKIDLDGELLLFDVAFAGAEELANGGAVFIPLDADRNGATGDRTGADYLVGIFADGAGLLKWNGTEMAAFSHRAMAVGRKTGGVLVGFCTCDIGTQSFDFAVVGVRGSDLDVAPDNGGTFPIATNAVEIQSLLYTPKPLFPKAGKRFTLTNLQARLEGTNEVVLPDSVACSAKLAGKSLKGTGAGGCSWLLPKKSKGKKLTVTVNVKYQGDSATFSQTFKVT